MKKERQSNFEILRIISILLIISFHITIKSNYIINTLNLKNYLIKTFMFYGELGVNLFILISGYFQIKSKFKKEKVIKIIIEILFYNTFQVILAYYLINEPIKIINLIYSPYWFIRSYLIIYLLSPIINEILLKLNKKIYKQLLLTSILIWSIYPTIIGLVKLDTESIDIYNRTIWLILMYILGAYINIYNVKKLDNKKTNILIIIITYLILLISIPIFYKLKQSIPYYNQIEIAFFWTPNNILMLTLSLSIFMLFKNITIKNNKIINKIASTTLGIYMIHDGFLARYINNNLINTTKYFNSRYAIIYILIITIIIFIIGVIIELIRQLIEKYTIDKILKQKKYQ